MSSQHALFVSHSFSVLLLVFYFLYSLHCNILFNDCNVMLCGGLHKVDGGPVYKNPS